jgi:hypothetical protein
MLNYDRLDQLTADLDVPLLRQRDLHWLQRNLSFRNRNHPLFEETFEEVKRLLREQKGITS